MSDQDFFFDEEPAKKDKAADKPAKSGMSKSQAKSAPAQSAPAPVATTFFEQSVSMSVAGMLAVIGILIGVILGFVLGGGMSGAANLPADTAVTVPTGSTGTAPVLTPEQQGGPLPSGHPKIGGTASGTPEATPTK